MDLDLNSSPFFTLLKKCSFLAHGTGSVGAVRGNVGEQVGLADVFAKM